MSTISSSTTTTTAYKVTADTTGTLVIQTGATPTTAVTVGTDQSVALAGNLTVTGTTTTTGYINVPNTFGFKNRIINGAMVIDQRNLGASVTPTSSGQFTIDRWQAGLSVSSKFSVQQSSTAPSGFVKSILVTSLSVYTVGATESFAILQPIEGLNMTDVGFGAAGASTLTLSFWVRSSLTGTFGGVLTNYANDRSYPFSYTISSANTFEQKTITITGDTTGTWNTTNTGWGQVWFGLGVGSSKSTTAGSWVAGGYYSVTGATSVVGTNGATFYITGVQLEKGSTATSFDYRPYTTELQLCQRYFQKSYDQSNVPGTATRAGCVQLGSYSNTATTMNNGVGFRFPVVMRAAPTMTGYDPDVANTTGQGRWDAAGVAATQGALTLSSSSDAGVASVTIATTGRTAGAGLTVLFHYTAAIEL